ncbi:hypothetical protein [Methanoregula sp. UBA64]|jgi:hypothetical protein|uniref:hypothetical protein n=1 Tax=Methanoregula sp. UBA64 TaxID=1915554 RepID=UPI0025E5A3FD|nr:hypothetical protein [Methanoregula sp. UBA64]
MPYQGHIHIIAAGENLPSVFTASFRDYPGITRAYVFTDTAVFYKHADPVIEKGRLAERNAISASKNTSTALGIPFHDEVISPPAYPSARDVLTRIRREYPLARYTFDCAGGSPALGMALLALAPWVNGTVRAVFDEKVMRPVPLPDLSPVALLSNPNYQTILALLIRHGKNEKKATAFVHVQRQYLYDQLWPLYVMGRAKKDPPAASYKKGRKAADELSQQMFSDFMAGLVKNGLAEMDVPGTNRKEKFYRITEKGEMTFRFGSHPATNALVKTVLEAL